MIVKCEAAGRLRQREVGMLILSISMTIVLLDQVSKFLVRQNIPLYPAVDQNVIIPDFFNLTHIQNTGAAWGILSGLSSWLAVLSFIVLILLVLFHRHVESKSIVYKIAMGLMTGGIIGNLIDRLRVGYVTDFLDFRFWGWHFPAFNVGDSAICIGVGLYLLWQFLEQKTGEQSVDH